MSKKRALAYRSKIQAISREGIKQPAIEPYELLLMMETVARWVSYEHKHKTYLTKELLWIAARILSLRAAPEKKCWEFNYDWPESLILMGLDDGFTVTDPIKFGWFWWQLGETGRFDIKKQIELIKSGKEPPEIEPLIITKPYWTPKVERQKLAGQKAREHRNEYIKNEIFERFFV